MSKIARWSMRRLPILHTLCRAVQAAQETDVALMGQTVVKKTMQIAELERQLWDSQCRLQVLKDAGFDTERVDSPPNKWDPLGSYTYRPVIHG